MNSQDDALGINRVRTAVRKALMAMEQPNGLVASVHERRQAAIIRNCMVEGVPQKQVASELGISLRHFYRELSSARAAFVKRFTAVAIVEEPDISPPIDIFELQLQRIRALKYAGSFDQAARSAQNLLDAIAGDDRKFEVLNLLAEVYAESGKLEPLLELEHDFMETDPDRFPASRKAMLAAIRTLQARVLWMRGRPDVAAAMCRPELFAENPKVTSPRERLMWASALLESAGFNSFMGDFDVSAPKILLAQDLLKNGERAGPPLQFRLLLALADLNLTSLAFADAKANIKRAYRLAMDHNLVAAAFDATLTLATAQMLDGDLASAATNAREAVGALTDMPIADKQWHLLVAAQIETGCKNSERALALLAMQNEDDSDAMRTWLVQAMEAECYAMQRRYKAASHKALSASRGFRKAGLQRALGYSLRIAAEAQAGIGTTPETREYITESVELLERYGHRRSLAKALELSAKCTGNRSHARRAKELLAEG